MPDLSTLALFAVACLALTATPGPDMLLIASRSASQGRAAGFASLAGIQVGTYCHALAAAFGLSQLFLAVPLAYDIVRYCLESISGQRNCIGSERATSPIPGRPDVSPGVTHQHS
jgi:hypothetical protein